MKSKKLLVSLVAVGLIVVSCDGGEAELSTTTSVMTGTTEAPSQETTTSNASDGGSEDPTGTTQVGETVTDSEEVFRTPTDNGDIVYIVVPPGDYTDVDLVNFLGDLKEDDPDLWGVEVFDDPAAAEAFTIPEDERSEEEQQLVDENHFVSLVSGDQVRFQGPFSEFGEFVLGS